MAVHDRSAFQHMVQTGRNKFSQEVHEMDSSDQVTYEEENMTVKVERVFIGEKNSKRAGFGIIEETAGGRGVSVMT